MFGVGLWARCRKSLYLSLSSALAEFGLSGALVFVLPAAMRSIQVALLHKALLGVVGEPFFLIHWDSSFEFVFGLRKLET